MAAPFDVAVSIVLLSQLVEMVILALGADHPHLLELMAAMRNRHLALMMQAVRPGGCAMLVTEVVSSDSCPELTTVAISNLPDLLRRSVDAGSFFTGLNPAVLRSMWRQSPELAPLTAKLQVARPWLWDFGPRVYACCAFCAIRRGSGPS